MAWKNKMSYNVEGMIIFVVLIYLWYRVLPVLWSTLQGETAGYVAVFLAFITYVFIGRKALRLLK